jgi:PTH1 family peptidyl-tRNA hydrolase
VALVRSWTYVNLSGRVMPELARYGDLSTGLLVVCDEIQLPLGAVRLRPSGSAGGHNGLKSIIGAIGDQFHRMRLGVGGPGAAAHPDYVLGKFTKQEKPLLDDMVGWAAEAATCWAVEGMDKAMTRYNRAGGPEDKDAKAIK